LFRNIGLSHPRKQEQFFRLLKKKQYYKNIKIKNKDVPSKLLEIYPLLRVDESNYRIRIHRKTFRRMNISEEELKITINELFCYQLKGNTGELLYFKSKNVYEYLCENFKFDYYWKTINKSEEIELRKEWNKVFKK
jgi:hypothetical protein